MTKLKITYFTSHISYLLIALLGLLSACTHDLKLDKGEYVLNKQNFQENKTISSEELEGLIPVSQKPNSLLFNVVKVRLGWYNFGLNIFNEKRQQKNLEKNAALLQKLPQEYVDAKIERKRQRYSKRISRTEENLQKKNAWLWRNLGEPPALITNEQIEETTKKLEKYLVLKGYRDAKVKNSIENLDGNKINLSYHIAENQAYTIDKVVYEIDDPQIDSIIKANDLQKKVAKNDLIDKSLIDAEVSRLDILLKNEGYYAFNAKYINAYLGNENDDYQSFKAHHKANLYFRINPPSVGNLHQKFKVDYVVFKGFDANNSKNIKADTVLFNGIKYIVSENRFPIKLLDKKITVRPNEFFSLKDIVETQRQIGLLNQFSFANPQWKTLPNNKLGLEIYAPSYDRYTFNANFGTNLVQNILGGGFNGVVTARNLLHKLELLEAGARFALDGQPAYVQSSKLRDRYSFETGVNFSIIVPEILTPFKKNPTKAALFNPKTTLGVGYNNSIPIWGQRLNFKFTGNHSWQPSQYKTYIVSFLDMNLVNTSYFLGRKEGKTFYDYLVAEQKNGNNLKVTYDPQFVSSFSGTYIFNTQSIQNQNKKAKFIRVFVESGGTLLNFFKNKDQIRFIENLFPIKTAEGTQDSSRAYFRFVKINFDYRRYFPIDKISSWAYRINVGIANPYGKNRALPYEKNFFAGGSNSVRAWSQRSLGLGSAPVDITSTKTIIPQAGDILLESSIEYRRKIARFFGDIQFAGFIDAGNIWKWYQIETPAKENKANFAFNRFYREFAVGTGAGLRWDFTYFMFRLDCGVKVIDPSKPTGQRFVLDELRIKRGNDYRPHLNFGIGYPF